MLKSFTAEQHKQLAKTADALTAYIGTPVLAQIEKQEDDREWGILGRLLPAHEEPDEATLLTPIGGPGAILLGQCASLEDFESEPFEAQFLWAIAITNDPDEPYVYINADGDPSDQSDNIESLLPFGLTDEQLSDFLAQADEDDEDKS